jgi:hypothetical protein
VGPAARTVAAFFGTVVEKKTWPLGMIARRCAALRGCRFASYKAGQLLQRRA